MKNLKIKLYNDGAEFIDDIFGSKIEKGYTLDDFEDYIYYEVTKKDKLEENNYTIYSVGSQELFAINNNKTLYEWYLRWCKIFEEKQTEGQIIDYINEEEKEVHIKEGDFLVKWVHIGEGWNGLYDENEPEDERLMRFDIFKRQGDTKAFIPVDSGSYCTYFPYSAEMEKHKEAARYIMDYIQSDDKKYSHLSLKKQGEHLSHMNPSWLEKENK